MESKQLSLLTLNCEGDKHLDLILPFLQEQNPDVICLQEVFEADMAIFEHLTQKKAYFLPTVNVTQPNRYGISLRGNHGIAILTDFPVIQQIREIYAGDPTIVPENEDGNPNKVNRGVLGIELQKEEIHYTILTTHFTWTSKGQVTEEQERNAAALLKILKKYDEYIICGDFNAPRSGEIYKELSKHYTDNIPPEITSTIDETHHYAGKIEVVVDYVFSTPNYIVSDVEILKGVSDHMAVKVIVTRTK